MIDPQLQGIGWIRQREPDLKIVRMDQARWVNVIVNVSFLCPCLSLLYKHRVLTTTKQPHALRIRWHVPFRSLCCIYKERNLLESLPTPSPFFYSAGPEADSHAVRLVVTSLRSTVLVSSGFDLHFGEDLQALEKQTTTSCSKTKAKLLSRFATFHSAQTAFHIV